MIQSLEPVREKLIELQKNGKLVHPSMKYGFEKGGVFLTIEFEIEKTRNYVCRSFTGKIMDGCVMQALSLLNEVK